MRANLVSALCLVLAVGASATARASYFQEYCSSADGSVVYATGHAENFLILTEEIGRDSERRVVYDRPVYTPEVLEEDTLQSLQDRICAPSGGGYGEWQVVRLKTIKFSPPPGVAFPAIQVRMLCREEGNSEVICPDRN